MDAKKAREKSEIARRNTAASVSKLMQEGKEEVVVAKRRGRAQAKRKWLAAVYTDIKKATKDGKREVVSFMTRGMFGPDDKPATVAFYSGVIERLKELLVAEGYKVKASLNRQHYKPDGSDPILPYSLDYIDPKIEVQW